MYFTLNKKFKNYYSILRQNFTFKKLLINTNKIINKITSLLNYNEKKKNIEWIKSNCNDIEEYAKKLDEEIWSETLKYFYQFEKESKKVLKKIEFKLGGGGAYHLLYFLTRKYCPEFIIETGVATGFSSAAILEAINKNKKGLLFSSDYPYPSLPNSEKYVGILVNKKLKKNWLLHTEGDYFNLNKIPVNWMGKVDLFHYDSSKWFKDKKITMKKVSSYLSKNAFVIFDDIQDDLFFYKLVSKKKYSNFQIIKFNNKYLGLIKL